MDLISLIVGGKMGASKVTNFNLSEQKADFKLKNKMKSIFLSIIVTCLLFTSVSYGQEKPFEGTIRMAVSTDWGEFLGALNEIQSSQGLIVKKIVERGVSGASMAFLSAQSGFYETMLKVKGNKYITFNTQTGITNLIDCDKGEVYTIALYAKVVMKQTIAEFKEMGNVGWKMLGVEMKQEIQFFPDSIKEIAGFRCQKVVVVGKIVGEINVPGMPNAKKDNKAKPSEKIISYGEFWYTDEINSTPECVLETGLNPIKGLTIVADTKTYEPITGVETPAYTIVTEVVEEKISDDVFIIPADYEVVTDMMKFGQKLLEAEKNKKTYTVGSEIPDTFWDF